MKELLADTAARAARYIAEIGERSVVPTAEDLRRLERLGGALPDEPSPPKQVLALLDEIGSPATVATTGGRYFGFVIGGSLPGALAANWLAGRMGSERGDAGHGSGSSQDRGNRPRMDS